MIIFNAFIITLYITDLIQPPKFEKILFLTFITTK